MSALPNQQAPALALPHGGVFENLILPNENAVEFQTLLRDLLTEYQPETIHGHIFVEQLALSHWILWRRQRAINAIESTIYAAEPNQDRWLKSDYDRLDRAERSKIQAERALRRALQNAESIRKNRQAEADRMERQTRWRAEHDVRERRIKVAEEKVNPAPKLTTAAADKPNPDGRKPIDWPTPTPARSHNLPKASPPEQQ
jgi:hypothetical protein